MLAAAISLPDRLRPGLRRGGVVDQAARVFFTLSFAMPAFWLGIILIIVFSVHLHVFPISGFGSGFVGHLYYLFLPALTIALGFSTVLVRSLRARHHRHLAGRVRRHRPDEGHPVVARCCGGTCSATRCSRSSRCSASTWPS